MLSLHLCLSGLVLLDYWLIEIGLLLLTLNLLQVFHVPKVFGLVREVPLHGWDRILESALNRRWDDAWDQERLAYPHDPKRVAKDHFVRLWERGIDLPQRVSLKRVRVWDARGTIDGYEKHGGLIPVHIQEPVLRVAVVWEGDAFHLHVGPGDSLLINVVAKHVFVLIVIQRLPLGAIDQVAANILDHLVEWVRRIVREECVPSLVDGEWQD